MRAHARSATSTSTARSRARWSAASRSAATGSAAPARRPAAPTTCCTSSSPRRHREHRPPRARGLSRSRVRFATGGPKQGHRSAGGGQRWRSRRSRTPRTVSRIRQAAADQYPRSRRPAPGRRGAVPSAASAAARTGDYQLDRKPGKQTVTIAGHETAGPHGRPSPATTTSTATVSTARRPRRALVRASPASSPLAPAAATTPTYHSMLTLHRSLDRSRASGAARRGAARTRSRNSSCRRRLAGQLGMEAMTTSTSPCRAATGWPSTSARISTPGPVLGDPRRADEHRAHRAAVDVRESRSASKECTWRPNALRSAQRCP